MPYVLQVFVGNLLFQKSRNFQRELSMNILEVHYKNIIGIIMDR